MPKNETPLSFEVSANLLRLIGRELVPSDELALIELIKNSYDAGAKRVIVTVQPVTEKQPGYIKVQDDGQGMGLADFKRIFMFAGYSERSKQAENAVRVPTGEKGIGRFATDRLGRHLVITTKAAREPQALKVTFDWDMFRNKTKKFNEINVPYEYTSVADLLRKVSGTTLQVTGLRSYWKHDQLITLRRTLGELIDPFKTSSDFQIVLEVPASAGLSGPVQPEAPEKADIEVRFRVLKDGQVSRRVKSATPQGKAQEEIIGSKAVTRGLVGVVGRLLYFVKRPAKSKTRGLVPGVQIYRDGFRVEPFGGPNADWLGLAERRAKRAGHAHLVPSRLFGFVEISRILHPDLMDTTSRQAFIASEAVQALVTFLREQTGYLEEKIRKEVSEPRWETTKAKKAIELERARLHSLGIMSFGLAHEMRQPLQTIRSEADNIKTRLLDLGIDDADIQESQEAIDESVKRMDETINLIAEIARGDVERIEYLDLAEILRKECQLFARQSSALGINVELKIPEKQSGKLSRAAVLTLLLNLWKNSVEAIQAATDGRAGRIVVSLSREPRRHVIEVADNGTGISEEIRSKLFKKFATEKTGGLGVGLYYCNLIVQAHGGTIECHSEVGVGTTFRAMIPDQE